MQLNSMRKCLLLVLVLIAASVAAQPDTIKGAGVSAVIMVIVSLGAVLTLLLRVVSHKVKRSEDEHVKADLSQQCKRVEKDLTAARKVIGELESRQNKSTDSDKVHNKLIEGEYKALSKRFLALNTRFGILFGWARSQDNFPTWLDSSEPEDSASVFLTPEQITALRGE